ncbi:carbohydrate ABC transporter permease [Kineosporia rhizophila]|uniref:carbohydrate ABC transporter permease n=1 Tax=Kineosporia TaxID=49184 RepID=UPI000A4EF009|nr:MULTISPECIES: carbohydrate ABC transporter permease [Kineosporia]MCE0535554.1 carbohydrate ABC transporter permease [Kineosporia rhizophila]GLY16651.1 sugar ABC transporter permease [Kineosporia sp. NBRC 101677]
MTAATDRHQELQVSRKNAWLTMGVLTLAAVYFLIPVWWLLVSATKDNTSLFSSNGFWFSGQSLSDNVSDVLTRQDGLFVRWLGNSLLYAGIGGALATLLGVACGYAIAKYDFRGRGVLFGGILAGVLIPSALLTVPLYLLFSRLGLVNSIWAVMIPAVVNPFAVYLGRVYAAAAVPDELIEAARIDGAGEIRIFFSIALRLMSPALVTVFLFTFVSIWNNFFLPLIMLSDQNLYPVTLGIYNWYTQTREANYNIVITGSLLSVIPLVVAFLSLQRFWRAGLTAGSVKS